MDEGQRAEQVRRVNAGSADALQRLIIHYDPVLRRVIGSSGIMCVNSAAVREGRGPVPELEP